MIETDYLVVGAGATGMIFVDEMLTHSDARFVIVDRRFRPGGHWNDAYPFVRLHRIDENAAEWTGTIPAATRPSPSSGRRATRCGS